MQNPFLLGDRIYLRPLERADAPKLTTWVNDREVTHFLKMSRPVSSQSEEEFIDGLRKSTQELVLGIVLKSDDQLIGCTGLHGIDNISRHCFFGILIGEKALWGKGLGAETTRLITEYAFEGLNLNRVWLHVYEYNTRGLKAYEKVGYRREGILRQHAFKAGRYWDVISMAILRQDWDELKKKPAF